MDQQGRSRNDSYMEKDRLAAFMDAVLAIIMTILVLALPKPEEVSFSAIWALKETYFCYTLSFFWLGTMWIGIHNEWHYVQKINRATVWWGLILLFTSSWIPYAISVVAMDYSNVTGQVMYGIAILLCTFSYVALSRSVTLSQGDSCDIQLARLDAMRRTKMIPDVIVKLIGLVLTIFVTPTAISFAVLICMIWMLLPWPKKPFFQPYFKR